MLPIALLSCLASALALAVSPADALPSPPYLVQLPPLAALSSFHAARSATTSRSTISSLAAPLARPLALLSSNRFTFVHRRARKTEREEELRDEREGEDEEDEEDERWESDEEEERQERELWRELLRGISKDGNVSPLFRELLGDEADEELLRDKAARPQLVEQDALLKVAPPPAMVDFVPSIEPSRDLPAPDANDDEPPRTSRTPQAILSAALDHLRSPSWSNDSLTRRPPHRASR
ncbi:hypothetical protein JCM1840_001130 [Sporobolomyces johnsonii]